MANQYSRPLLTHLLAQIPRLQQNQKEAFNTIIKETLGEDCNYDSVISINETLNEAIAANKDEEGPVLLIKK